jgi:hypothetical protein
MLLGPGKYSLIASFVTVKCQIGPDVPPASLLSVKCKGARTVSRRQIQEILLHLLVM